MKAATLLRCAVIGLACLIPALWCQWRVHGAMGQLEKISARQLERCLTPLLVKAHERQDDLAAAELLGALLKTPGVRETKEVNGKFKVVLSTHARKRLELKVLAVNVMLWSVLAAAFILYSLWCDKARSQLEENLRKLAERLEDETHLRMESQRRAGHLDGLACSLAQNILRHVEKPLIVLDAQQHVAALSQAALEHLQLRSPEDALNKSWLDVPLLQHQGKRIEQALQTASHDWVEITVE